jgi:acetyl coenzyme A synthetase (ADP forming)-like protein
MTDVDRTSAPAADHARPPAHQAHEAHEGDVLLRDGGVVHVRSIRPDDLDRHERFVVGLSAESSYLRFFSPLVALSDDQRARLCDVDGVDRQALVGLVDDEIVAVARYERLDATRAEVAFVVADEHQGRGLGTLLLEHLAAAALAHGITTFEADVLSANEPMLQVFRDAGFGLRLDRPSAGVTHVLLAISPTDLSRARIGRREHEADVASLHRLLEPRSVAVIGAGRRPTNIGHQVLVNLLSGGFQGSVHAVNRSADEVAGVAAVPSIAEVGEPVDLAVVAVPEPQVLEVVEACGRAGVGAVVVVSAGFAETGPAGAEREHDVVLAARRAGMRLVGPNCIGLANTAIGLNATFAATNPLPGNVAFLSQSGALGIALLDWTAQRGLGLSSFVSVGNKADVSASDLLQHWEDDPTTDVVLLYLESFGNPRRFSRISRRVSMRKPIVVVKAGRSRAGSRAAASHTAAAANADTAVGALLAQTGVIRVDTLDQLLDTASVLASQPLPAGDRVAVVGNSGGPGILAADACSAAGLEVDPLGDGTQEALRQLLGADAAVGNPVDLVATAGAEQYEEALRLVLADPGVDSVIVIHTPTVATAREDVAEAIARGASGATKPVVASLLAWSVAPTAFAGTPGRRRIPSFPTPEPAAMALGRVAVHARWRRRDQGTVPTFADVDRAAADAVVAEQLGADASGRWLDLPTASRLLSHHGIDVVAGRPVSTADQAVAAAAGLGYPVVLKPTTGSLLHKTELGVVRLGLRTPSAVRIAFAEVSAELDELVGPGPHQVAIQPLVPTGLEVIVGVTQDPTFGPLLMFGMGGIATELLADRAFRVLPLTTTDAGELVRSLRASPLLFGYRRTTRIDVAALEQLLLRVAAMADATPALAELDLNPVILSDRGWAIVDVKARLAPPALAPLDQRGLS